MKIQLLCSAVFLMLSTAVSGKSPIPKPPNLRGLAQDSGNSTTPYSSSSSEDIPAFDSDSEDYDLDPEGVFAASTPFNDGRHQGESAAHRLWTRMGGDCANAWGDFERRVRRDIRDRGWDGDGRNWRETSFNQGARAGMNDVVKEKERRCLHDDPSECIDLGNTAADMIAYEHCKISGIRSVGHDYRPSCKQAAITRCGGAVYDKVRNTCGAPNDTGVLDRLANKCSRQVTDLIGKRSSSSRSKSSKRSKSNKRSKSSKSSRADSDSSTMAVVDA